MGSASCFLQTPVSGFALALLALSFRPVTADVLVSLLASTRSSSAPCRAHLCSRLFHARLRRFTDPFMQRAPANRSTANRSLPL
jgi:hypothetical protein